MARCPTVTELEENKVIGNYRRKEKKMYAIYGTGSIRLAIALANYYASFLKKKVAIGEVGAGSLTDISEDAQKNVMKHTDNTLIGFTNMRVDYYPYINMDECMKLCNEEYDAIVWVFQEISHDYMNLFRMCNKRIFLTNIASYNRRLFCRTKNLFEHDMVEVEIYCYLLNKKDKVWYEKTVGKSKFFSNPNEITRIKNPDKLTRNDITFLEKVAAG